MSKRTVLTIEDDGAIRQGIVDALDFHGFDVLQAGNGRQGLELALNAVYDLLLLDVVLPECDGLKILKEVRDARSTVPVILLTAKGDENDRVQGLRLGADDYVVKPFSVKELLARVEAVLRRSPERPHALEAVEFGEGTVDFARCEIRYNSGGKETLSERENELLRYLAGNSGRVITREEILTRVWRISARGVETRTIDMHIARLREKLRDNGAEPQVVKTVRGKGYMFAVPLPEGSNHA
jgi:DNA-binding response OmpR family regulator